MSRHRLLFIDAYDSFSNNIISLLRCCLPVTVEVIKHDDPRFVLNDEAFGSFLDRFDAVVAGPGPGHPANPEDVGLISRLWTLPQPVPVLGICLGFQSLCLAYGAQVRRLEEPRHGIVTAVAHCGSDVFESAGEVEATQYHSLHVILADGLPVAETGERRWLPQGCIQPLAWDFSDERNGPILMAAKHTSKPFWGVQFHPESICTNEEGRRCITEWWREVVGWTQSHCRDRFTFPIGSTGPQKEGHIHATAMAMACDSSWDSERSSLDGDALNTPVDAASSSRTSIDSGLDLRIGEQKADLSTRACVQWLCLDLPECGIEAADVVDMLLARDEKSFLLESGTRNGKPLRPDTGRFSILGLQEVDSAHIRYFAKSRTLEVSENATVLERIPSNMNEATQRLHDFVEKRRAVNGPAGVPFWGGLAGFISYEAGLETIAVASAADDYNHPDVWFVSVERSVVVDHLQQKVYVQSLRCEEDKDWLLSTKQLLEGLSGSSTSTRATCGERESCGDGGVAAGPKQGNYCDEVCVCQEHIRAGSSYELCLTDQTLVDHRSTTAERSAWDLYRRLRQLNPAPFGAYMCTADLEEQGVSILSSSPERFLSWSRSGRCQYRPIKGTVKKGPGVTREDAEQQLSSMKERAENLMIVDLIRHDLNGVRGVEKVNVPKLMVVEEYETVYQLVSVIEGQLSPDGRSTGIEVLVNSLPPGSMTGAPKKRSCELLAEVEGKPRGVYSGVLGYLDVGGGGDFSVVIRTAFKWKDEGIWRVGAGGAITALSEPEAEWEEMEAKLDSTLRLFL